MSDENWITPEKPVYVVCNPPEDGHPSWGLMWGHGSPSLAHLQAVDHWVVAKVVSYRDVELRGERCVEFEDHEIVFEGRRSEAIDALIALGADPAQVSPQIQIKQDASVAQTGNFGTSIVVADGFADTGACGYAETGDRGIARTGEGGYAKAGNGGMAIVQGKRYGTAVAGDRGIAIGEEQFKYLSVGDGGVAIAANGKVSIGSQAIGIVRSGEWVSGGHECIAIGEVVSGGPESLLISKRWDYDFEDDKGKMHIACGVVGRDGIEPWRKYTAKDGVLVKLKETSDE
jgi:hypothetical protein